MIDVTSSIVLGDDDLRFEFVRASGPGGQNVNRVSTAVLLRFDVMHCAALPEAVRQRVLGRYGRRIGADGVLVIKCGVHRTQARNRAEAVERLVRLIRAVATPPRPRHVTRPTASAKAKRLQHKRRRGDQKRLRGAGADDE